MAFNNEVGYGTNLVLKVDDVIIGCAKSHTIDISNSPREIACKDDEGWAKSAYGKSSWTASADGLVNYAFSKDGTGDAQRYSLADMMALITNRTVVELVSEYNDGTGSLTQTGDAIVTSVSQTGADGDNITYSISFQGSGKLTTLTA